MMMWMIGQDMWENRAVWRQGHDFGVEDESEDRIGLFWMKTKGLGFVTA